MGKVKVFGAWVSPFSMRVKVALQMKGVEYDYVEEDLLNKSEDLLNYNPIHNKVPVMLIDGKPIAESLVIMDYIDEAWTHNPILPSDPYERARARFWAKFIDDTLFPQLIVVFMSHGEESEKATKEVDELLTIFEKELNGKKFFGGDNIGFLDIVASILAIWIPCSQVVIGKELIARAKHPWVYTWADQLLQCTVIKQNMPDQHKLEAYYQANGKKLTSFTKNRDGNIRRRMGEVKVYRAWASCFSMRVEVALKMKGVKYEYVEEDLLNKSDELLQYNPIHKKIPVMVVDGKPIAESLVIMEYIDETWKGDPHILPSHPYDRARARFWSKFVDDKILPQLKPAFVSNDGEQSTKAIKELDDLLTILENEIKGKKFFGGNNIGFVDIVASVVVIWIPCWQVVTGKEVLTREKFPSIYSWADELLECSVIKQNMPDQEKLQAFYRDRFALMNAKTTD